MQREKMSLHKKMAAVIACICVLAITLTTTYAWYTKANKLNEFKGSALNQVVIQELFNAKAGLKQVHVENTGSKDESMDVYVRVKLNEFMTLESKERPEGLDTDETMWQAHAPKKGQGSFCANHGNPGCTWLHHEECYNVNTEDEAFHDYFTWTWGGQRYYMPAEVDTNGVIEDTEPYNGTEPGVKQTPPSNIISIDYYLATMASDNGWVGWIYDSDGWAYWSHPLAPGTSTALLLNGVKTSEVLEEDYDYYYAIDVIMEAVDKADLPMWRDGAVSVRDDLKTFDRATANGQALINIIAAR